MLPSYIRNEMIRRIRHAGELIPSLIQALGIDPGAVPTEPAEPLAFYPDEGEPIRGTIPFELTVSALGESVTLDCRVNFAVTLGDEKMIDALVSQYEVLEWRNAEEAVDEFRVPVREHSPRWEQIDLARWSRTPCRKSSISWSSRTQSQT